MKILSVYYKVSFFFNEILEDCCFLVPISAIDIFACLGASMLRIFFLTQIGNLLAILFPIWKIKSPENEKNSICNLLFAGGNAVGEIVLDVIGSEIKVKEN